MATVETRICDQCVKPMVPTARRFLFTAILVVVNSTSERAERGQCGPEVVRPLDLCSSACVIACVNDMIREVSIREVSTKDAKGKD